MAVMTSPKSQECRSISKRISVAFVLGQAQETGCAALAQEKDCATAL